MKAAERPLRVITIDDDPFELKLIGHQLAHLGVSDVLGFTDPLEALDRIESDGPGAFDLVLCDLQMPGIDGIALQRRLVRLHYDGELILFSGEDDRTIQAAARLAVRQNLNLLGILKKPVDLSALRLMLAKAATPRRDPRVRSASKLYPPDELRRALAAALSTPPVPVRAAAAEDGAIAARVAEAAFAAWCFPAVSMWLDTFADIDRGYFVRHGLADRRLAPHTAGLVLRHLHAALAGLTAPADAAVRAAPHGRVITARVGSALVVLALPGAPDPAAATALLGADPGRLLDLATGRERPGAGPTLAIRDSG